ncbi:glycosyltransferase [Marinifilum sp. D737]|uniref:glycosyltransferase n=1 Tax=Marinifilum sp. D737 TaxID=2969628 RepID=UPI0022750F63|nr:glycosyltransferase [Marinifilum sp. D737]MCY1634885.1 glycosyltransferase [Marinifilum sp. D737]
MFDFSVSISVYKNDNITFFKDAIESIIHQTLIPNEIILVVDGPVYDNMKSVIKGYDQNLDILKVIWLDENMGHGNARRIGLENCTNNLVALMDSDDISLPDRFAKQIECFKRHPEVSIVGGYIDEFIDSTNNIVGRRLVELTDLDIKKYLKSRCPMNQVTVMFKKSDIIEVGGYIDWYNNEDYYLWARMCLADKIFMNLDEVLVHVRVGNEMYKRRGGWKYFKSEQELQKFLMKNNVINLFKYSYNVIIRFIIQVALPNNLRGFIFKTLFRS